MVIVETDGGIEGVGLGSHVDIGRLFPALEGQDPRATVALYDRMLAHVFKSGHSGATFGGIGALDMALWDLKAKLAGEPLWRTLGAHDRYVPGYASCLEIAVDEDALAALYAGWVERGFTSVKVKGGLDLDRDLARLATIREVFTANTARPALMFDSNEAWNRKQAIRYISALEAEFDLTWVEEPLRRWDAEGLAIVSRAVRAAIATGENLTGLEQYKPLLDASAVDIVQTNAAWGITNFLRVATVAHSRDLPISPVGYCFPIAHAAAAVPNHLSTEIQDLGNPFGVSLDQTIADGGLVPGRRARDRHLRRRALDRIGRRETHVVRSGWAARTPRPRRASAGGRGPGATRGRCQDVLRPLKTGARPRPWDANAHRVLLHARTRSDTGRCASTTPGSRDPGRCAPCPPAWSVPTYS